MKILYDHQTFTWQKFGGISRYFCEIIKNMPNDIETIKSGVFSNNIYLTESLSREYLPFFPNLNTSGRKKERIIEIPNKLNSIYQINKGNYDLLHPTNYDCYFLRNNKKPFVITIHDMSHEIFFPFDKKTIESKKELAHKAKHIITISENTKKDILLYYKDISPDKITVIYHGNSIAANNIKESNLKMTYEYILYTGDRSLYKNFEPFVRAVSPILIERNLFLVCTGKPFNKEELLFFQIQKISNRVIHNFVSDLDLGALYKQAKAFVFPSLYEGFGIPILESFAAGCPAILSNTSSLPEIGGDAAVYFNPTDEINMREVIDNTINDENLRNNLIIKGTEKLRLFDWKKTALETANVYRNSI